MNFITAIQHADKGYGIKRASWNQYLMLASIIGIVARPMPGAHNQDDYLVFTETGTKPFAYKEGQRIELELEDYQATDWVAL